MKYQDNYEVTELNFDEEIILDHHSLPVEHSHLDRSYQTDISEELYADDWLDIDEADLPTFLQIQAG